MITDDGKAVLYGPPFFAFVQNVILKMFRYGDSDNVR